MERRRLKEKERQKAIGPVEMNHGKKKSPVALQITNIYSNPELSKYGPVLVMHVLL